ncbi:Type 1 glutamine amidotransferase-like domain-containing protein [Hymenobacter arizonensis]|uniref:Dipeptidase E n=1 Tax=Hymenobacter arizonensis TaxID=1227077 RepID=A0A1I6BR93_HYMAR|nr:Type 1 glutamine amidotransferase-like domain-containing protein [Hymenobacter arizonensis]SFQ83468.1 dipeptidase E [Hymenobacter arizonensis]
MKYYLSSYKFGNCVDRLVSLLPAGARIGHVHNARDHTAADATKRRRSQAEEIAHLTHLGFAAEALDLKDYFHREDALRSKLEGLHGLWVSGGNTFVLRQAMRLSGFDRLVHALAQRPEFVYAGYSAGICVLSSSLRYLHLVDAPYDYPYADGQQTIWEGLGLLDYALLPHYDSDHPESADIGQTVAYCIEHKLLFKALRDGEVLLLDEEQT